MYRTSSEKYAGGCAMLTRLTEEAAAFMGTAVLVHHKGYLLTSAHILGDNYEDLAVVWSDQQEEYAPLRLGKVEPVPVSVMAIDRPRDIAVLKLDYDADISMPDQIIGSTEDLAMGVGLVSLGFPFGHRGLHHLTAVSGIVASKLISPAGNRHLLFDAMTHPGDIGGPLINTEDQRIVGIVCGRYCPMPDGTGIVAGPNAADGIPDTGLSYAVAIEYAVELMKGLDLEIN